MSGESGNRLSPDVDVGSVLPRVSVVMPVRNEEPFVDAAIEGLLKQDYPSDRMELLVVDGLSSDRTREKILAWGRRTPLVKLIENPGRIVPTGFNRALHAASGEVILRMDGHCEYPPDYIRRVVALRSSMNADNAGGVVEPIGSSWTQRAICAAYHSRVGLGGAALKGHGSTERVHDVDAVHGGCWLASRLKEVGGMDEAMVRNQDDELSFRLRKSGGRIVQNTGIRVRYHVRSRFSQLFMQFLQYGFWKVRVIRKHPQQASLRHWIPGCFVGSLLLFLLLSILWSPFLGAAGLLLLGYLGAISVASVIQLAPGGLGLLPGTVLALAAMHFGYGAGFLSGWLVGTSGQGGGSTLFERVTR